MKCFFVLYSFIFLVLVACAPQREVVREVPVEVPQIVERHDTVRVYEKDTDSVRIYTAGDTVFQERWRTRWRDREVKVVVHDTITKPVTVKQTEVKEVERSVRWWESMLMAAGVLLLIGVPMIVVAWKKLN